MNLTRLDCARQLTCGPSPSPVWKPPRAHERSAVSLLPNPHARCFTTSGAVTLREPPLHSPPPPVHLPNGRRGRRFVPRAWTPRHWTAFRLPRAAPPPLPNPATPSPGRDRASTRSTLSTPSLAHRTASTPSVPSHPRRELRNPAATAVSRPRAPLR